jgi:hypothetical protein
MILSISGYFSANFTHLENAVTCDEKMMAEYKNKN